MSGDKQLYRVERHLVTYVVARDEYEAIAVAADNDSDSDDVARLATPQMVKNDDWEAAFPFGDDLTAEEEDWTALKWAEKQATKEGKP